ncbi:squalene synthase HpnC [Novimethylophilus kurashikiensis]|uniref:Squalene synthase HpnC n=2 Tax=Novimethylophilus kurashikiensis TaxID=1825523 RepID=A0A2R5F8I1_9PROT|nr:squalene synthase HpnC [Novimethylophilus kurashikiensis]
MLYSAPMHDSHHRAEQDSLKLANSHYENFPVASVLLPMRLRRAIGVIYAFARNADDFADEGDLPPEQRLALLDGYRKQLDRIAAGETPEEPLFIAVAAIIREHALPIQLFHDLLDAFSQDVVKKRYENLGELMDYCRRSANPIGRLLLHLYKETDERNLAYSDAICSSLQIINFLQDVAIDYKKDRIYIPQDDLRKFRISEQQIANGDAGGNWWMLMQFEIERTRRLLQAGAPLGLVLKGRIGLEMRSIIAGGETILRKLHRSHGDMFNHRPVLRPWDWAYILYRAVRAK